MATIEVKCPHCDYEGKKIVKAGLSSSGKQRYHCRFCGRYFQLDYVYNACKPGVKEQIVELAMNSSGVRDTTRVLKISINTVISTLKKSGSQTSQCSSERGERRCTSDRSR